jgi:hypothetical protein
VEIGVEATPLHSPLQFNREAQMPALTDPRREAFAWGLAEGLNRLQAYSQSGFKGKSEHAPDIARRMARRADIVARVDEIRREMDWSANADIATVINQLAWLVRKARKLDSVAALVAAKSMLSEVVKLKGKLGDARAELIDTTPPEPPMSKAEWIATYGRRE